MKKTIISIAAAVVCASVLSVPAFAEDVLTDRSIYVENREELAQSVKGWDIEGKTILPDTTTIMPVYSASIYDYAKTGSLEIKPFMALDSDGKDSNNQWHIADAMDENGNYVGKLDIIFENELFDPVSFLPSDRNEVESIAFEANAKRVNALMKKRSLNTDCKEVKLLSIEGVGYAYYIDNGTEKILVAANISDVNARIFNDENGGIVIVGDELKAAAEEELAAHNEYLEEYQKILDSLDPNDPLPAGGYDMPTFKVDNTPYLTENDSPTTSGGEKNPDTGRGVGIATGAAALISLTAGVVVLAKRRKDNRRNQL